MSTTRTSRARRSRSGSSPVKQPLTPRELLGKLFAPIVALGLLALKFGVFAIKFFGIFISVGGYALIWGWRFAAGFVAADPRPRAGPLHRGHGGRG